MGVWMSIQLASSRGCDPFSAAICYDFFHRLTTVTATLQNEPASSFLFFFSTFSASSQNDAASLSGPVCPWKRSP